VSHLACIKAVLFDLHNTLAHKSDSVEFGQISEYLFSRGYEISPQQFEAAWSFVSFIDYPKYGYRGWRSYLSRIFWRLEAKVDETTLDHVVELFESRPYRLYSDVVKAVVRAKKQGFKTAIVTTIACFKFENAIQPIRNYFDFVMTGYEAGVDKPNPKMYLKVLEILGVKPCEAVMIGDEIPFDILLPKQLGINAILLDRGGRNKAESIDVSVCDLSEVIDFILSHFQKGA
jgi:HAD superfamily hydrolase (TIGR01509 family)